MRVWVIGADSGIGQALVHYLRKLNHNVYGTGKHDADVRSRTQLNRHYRVQGKADEVVYCAGVPSLGWIVDNNQDQLMEAMRVNCMGFVNLLHVLAKNQPEGGRVIGIVSDAAWRPMRASIGYCISKAAMAMAIKCGARELGPKWRVNGIAPTIVDGTPMTDYLDDKVPKIRGWTDEEYVAQEKQIPGSATRLSVNDVCESIAQMLGSDYLPNGEIVPLRGSSLGENPKLLFHL